MRDRREEILARLVEIAAGLVGPTNTYRNPPELSANQVVPCAVIYDGNEDATNLDLPGNHSGRAPNLVVMVPTILLLQDGQPATVGTRTNTLRRQFLALALTDSALAAIAGTNGKIRYAGLNAGVAAGEKMEMTHAVRLAITYPLIPAELAD